MALNNASAGIAYITVDGASYDIAGECSYTLSSETREAMTGMNGVHGPKRTIKAGMIKIQGRNGSAVDIGALGAILSASVVLELVNGKTIIGRNMWREGEPIEVNAEDGTFPLEFAGPSVTEN